MALAKQYRLILVSALAVALCLLVSVIQSGQNGRDPFSAFRFPIVTRLLRSLGIGPRVYSGGFDHDQYDQGSAYESETDSSQANHDSR
jgi:hypothetical protein